MLTDATSGERTYGAGRFVITLAQAENLGDDLARDGSRRTVWGTGTVTKTRLAERLVPLASLSTFSRRPRQLRRYFERTAVGRSSLGAGRRPGRER
jgi:hypothetical protein